MGRMKVQYIFYIVVLLFVYLGVSGTGQANNQETLSELKAIIKALDNHDVEVSNWQLYTRQQMNHVKDETQLNEEFTALKKKAMNFQWEQLEAGHNGQYKAVATLHHSDLNITETLTYIVYPHHEQLHSYLIYDLQGTKAIAENHWFVLSEIVENRLGKFFIKDAIIFTCATGNSSDKLSLGLSERVDNILKEFSAKQIEQLKEETFISVSAYTNTWNNKISTNGQKMNLQVAIRASEGLGGNTTVTIGTPIITTEY